MATSSVRISADLLDQARDAAKSEFRSVQGQLEYWARVGKAASENPDLPTSFVMEAVSSLAEPRSLATEFVPRSSSK
jgi:hypothetical protein